MFTDDKNLISECSIDIRTELNRTAAGTVKEPLFVKYSGSEYKLMIPDENGELKFKTGETALIACTSDNKPNVLTLSKCSKLILHDVILNSDSLRHARRDVHELFASYEI